VDAGPTLIGMPLLTGDGGEYEMEVVVTVEVPVHERARTTSEAAARMTG